MPSLKFTVIEPPLPASATTWLLVRMLPSLDSTMPEPEPAPLEPVTLILTTEGSTAAATFSTAPWGLEEALEAVTGPEEDVAVTAEPLSPRSAS